LVAIVTVPGFLKTRKQSKFLGTYLLKIHNKYDELCKTTKPANKNENEYMNFLHALRCDIIYLLRINIDVLFRSQDPMSIFLYALNASELKDDITPVMSEVPFAVQLVIRKLVYLCIAMQGK